MTQHFPGCHPEDDEDPREAPKTPADTENCWHCGTATVRGCNCFDCADNGYIPPTAIYHCPTCGRWWAYMTGLNITTLTFGAETAEPITTDPQPGETP